jgi:hypothetical protein
MHLVKVTDIDRPKGLFTGDRHAGERNAVFFRIRALTPPQAAGNALAFTVQSIPKLD